MCGDGSKAPEETKTLAEMMNGGTQRRRNSNSPVQHKLSTPSPPNEALLGQPPIPVKKLSTASTRRMQSMQTATIRAFREKGSSYLTSDSQDGDRDSNYNNACSSPTLRDLRSGSPRLKRHDTDPMSTPANHKTRFDNIEIVVNNPEFFGNSDDFLKVPHPSGGASPSICSAQSDPESCLDGFLNEDEDACSFGWLNLYFHSFTQHSIKNVKVMSAFCVKVFNLKINQISCDFA
ncbi:hypothetical protein Ddc_13413 [Ditylenchus destructor]|nr:hypothetical protein Ddc_13413 [Ditylenchus destructor]